MSTADELVFKKTTQTVDRPPVSDHDFHEDMLRDPPRNVPQSGGTLPEMKAPKDSEIDERTISNSAMGENDLGRIKKDVVEAELIDQSETTSRG